MMKKHSLNDHIKDCTWYLYSLGGKLSFYGVNERESQTATMIAYERWLNNKDLLSNEDKKKKEEE